jgi:hypothetical protein
MNLQNISIEPGADGFRITDNRNEIPEGTGLRAQYETSEGWQTNDFVFRREPATMFHPIRRSMFVYTGKRPSRIVLLATGQNAAAVPIATVPRSSFNSQSFFGQRNFNSWPHYNHGIWNDDDYLPYFLGMHFHDTRLSQNFLASQHHHQQQQTTTGDWGSSGQHVTQTSGPLPVASPDVAAAATNAAVESTGIALGGGAEIFPTADTVNTAAADATAAADTGDASAAAVSDSPSDPNAY